MTSLALNIRLSREEWLIWGRLNLFQLFLMPADWVKQIAGLIKEIKPVKAIIDEIATEAEAIIAGLKNFCSEN